MIDRIDPRALTHAADPAAYLAPFRDRAPVQWGDSPFEGLEGCWYVTGHAEVSEALTVPWLGRAAPRAIAQAQRLRRPPEYAALAAMFPRWLVFLDPPAHTRLRGPIQQAFSPRRVDALRPAIRLITDEVCGQLTANTFDLVGDFALPISLRVITTLLGLEDPDIEVLARHSAALARGSRSAIASSVEAYRAGGQAAEALAELLGKIVCERRRCPSEDLISALVCAHGGGLEDEDIIATAVHLLTAGHETVVHLLSKGTLALARACPDRLGARDPEAVDPGEAVEELLRRESPVQLVTRWVLEDLRWAGVDLRRGQAVGLSIGAANRDPRAFERPETLDLRRFASGRGDPPRGDQADCTLQAARAPVRPLAFGAGIHHCLGAALARCEGAIIFDRLWRRFPRLTVPAQSLHYTKSLIFHGLKRLEVRG